MTTVFTLTTGMLTLLMFIGAVTIMGAVLAALVQHDLRRLLAFHAVSQVGYMVLGISTGLWIGVIGGLFHMLNHAIYKCTAFITGTVPNETLHILMGAYNNTIDDYRLAPTSMAIPTN